MSVKFQPRYQSHALKKLTVTWSQDLLCVNDSSKTQKVVQGLAKWLRG